jgi:hypothetical protein
LLWEIIKRFYEHVLLTWSHEYLSAHSDIIRRYLTQALEWIIGNSVTLYFIIALTYIVGVLAAAHLEERRESKRNTLQAGPLLIPEQCVTRSGPYRRDGLLIQNRGDAACDVVISPIAVALGIADFERIDQLDLGERRVAVVEVSSRWSSRHVSFESAFAEWQQFLGRESLTVEFNITYRDSSMQWYKSRCELTYAAVRTQEIATTVRFISRTEVRT